MRPSDSQRGRKKRGAWLRGCAPQIILLTAPCYCVGFVILEWDRLVVPAVERAAPRLVEWILSPVGLAILAIIVLLLLTEPFHGGLSSAGAGVASSVDPGGCLIAVALLSLLVIVVLIWLGQ